MVKTAVNLGVTRADGRSLLATDVAIGQPAGRRPAPPSRSAWSTSRRCRWPPLTRSPPRTASTARRSCSPRSSTTPASRCRSRRRGATRRSPSGSRRRSNYILQGVLDFPGATAYGMGLADYQAAGKTGTSNVESGNGTPFAAFAGYTTELAGYVSVFNPVSPTKYTMAGESACYPAGVRGPALPRRDVRRERPAVDVAHDLRPRQPVRFGGLPAGPVMAARCGTRATARRSSSRPRRQARATRAAATGRNGAPEGTATAAVRQRRQAAGRSGTAARESLPSDTTRAVTRGPGLSPAHGVSQRPAGGGPPPRPWRPLHGPLPAA